MKPGLKTPGSFYYCSNIACISCANCCLQHCVSKNMIWQWSSRDGTPEVRQSWSDFTSEGSVITSKKTEQTFHGQPATLCLKMKCRHYILLVAWGKKSVPSSLFDWTMFIGTLSDYVTTYAWVLFTSFHETSSYLKCKNLHFLFNSIQSNSACNWQKSLLVSFYLLHSNSPWWTWIYSSTRISCPK